MIPRHIHMLWLQGWDAAPELARHNSDRWAAMNPGWTLHRHDAGALGALRGDLPLDPGQLPPQAQADLFRAHRLHREGGVWVDASVVPQRPLEDWFAPADRFGFFAFRGSAPSRVMDNWLMAARPGHRLIDGFWQAALRYWQPAPKPLLRPPFLGRDPLRQPINRLTRLQRLGLPRKPRDPRDYVRADGPAAWRHVFPYFWFQFLFADMIATRPDLAEAWAETPSLPAEGAHAAAWHLKADPEAPLIEIVAACDGEVVQKLRFKRSLSADRQLEIARALSPTPTADN